MRQKQEIYSATVASDIQPQEDLPTSHFVEILEKKNTTTKVQNM